MVISQRVENRERKSERKTKYNALFLIILFFLEISKEQKTLYVAESSKLGVVGSNQQDDEEQHPPADGQVAQHPDIEVIVVLYILIR